MTAEKIRPYDVQRALNLLASKWPKVIVPEKGKRQFSSSAAHAVLMALHRHYNWETFAIAMPVGWRNRARPAEDVDLARETRLSPRTVGAVMRWLTDEQHILVTTKGHGWTGARVRRFDLAKLGLADSQPEPESVMVTDSDTEGRPERESVMVASKSVMVTGLEGRNQESVTEVRHGEQRASRREFRESLAELTNSEWPDGPDGEPCYACLDVDRWEKIRVQVPNGAALRLREGEVEMSAIGSRLTLWFRYAGHLRVARAAGPLLRRLVREALGPDIVVELLPMSERDDREQVA